MSPRRYLHVRAAHALLRRRALACLCGLSLAAAAALAEPASEASDLPAVPPQASASAVAALQRAEERLRGVQALREVVGDARRHGNDLQSSAKELADGWRAVGRAEGEAAAAVDKAQACVARLRAELDAGARDREALGLAVAASQRAVQQVARAQKAHLVAGVRVADDSFARRARAEAAMRSRAARIESATSACGEAIAGAERAVRYALDRARAFVAAAKKLPIEFADAGEAWRTVVARNAAAAERGWLQTRAGPIAWPDGERVRALARAVESLTPPALRTLDLSGALRTFGQQRDAAARMQEAMIRMRDAAAFLAAMSCPAGTRGTVQGCRALVQDRAELTRRLRETGAHLDAARAEMGAAVDALDGTKTLAAWVGANRDWLAMIEAAVTPAVEEAAGAGSALTSAAEAALHAADAAVADAQRQRDAAYELVYGEPPPVPPVHQSAAAAMAAPKAAMMAAPLPELRSHAYEVFDRFDGERKDFGAYTYVLMRSAQDLRSPEARGRFDRLLEILKTLPEARLVADRQKAQVNLFCIPGSVASAANGGEQIVYAADLGQQLMLHAQHGLLTRPEIRKRLIESAGPFLLTLPARISAAGSDAPLLFADLSGYPQDAVRDLVTAYMSGLLDDFPTRQTLWKPSLSLRVALVMIHFAENVRGIVETPMPTALARPASP